MKCFKLAIILALLFTVKWTIAQTPQYVGCFYIVSAQSRLLSATKKGKTTAIKPIDNIRGDEEKWNIYAFEDGHISLQNFNSKFWLCSEQNGDIITDRTTVRIWEMWSLHGVNGRIALKSYHDKWLCANGMSDDNHSGGDVIANRKDCNDNEKFTLIPIQVEKANNTAWWNSVQNASKKATKLVQIKGLLSNQAASKVDTLKKK